MKFQVTEIEFDFTGDDPDIDELDVETQDEIYDEVMGTFWEVDDEEDLVDAISDSTGWCIKSIDYQQVFS
jgi:hypothetical protein